MRLRHAPALLLTTLVVAALLPCGVVSAAPVASRPRHGINVRLAAAATSATPFVPSTPGATTTAAPTADASASAEASLTTAGQAIVAMTWKNVRTGSGIVIAPNRVLTSTRVLKQNDPTVRIMTVQGVQYSFTVVARDEALGLALLAPDGEMAGVGRFVGWADANTLIADQPVLALGIQSTSRSLLEMPGKISAPAAATGGSLILTDIRLDPLVEGGGLVLPNGKLVGVVTAKSRSPEVGELGWAVTSEAARKFLGGIEAAQQAKAEEALNTIIRRWVVRGILLVFAGLFGLFGWWFRGWYKRMEEREAAMAAAEDAAAHAAE